MVSKLICRQTVLSEISNKGPIFSLNKAEHAVQSYAAGRGGRRPGCLGTWKSWGLGAGQGIGQHLSTSFRPQAMLMSNYTAFWTKRREEKEEKKEKEENGGSQSCHGLWPAAKNQQQPQKFGMLQGCEKILHC